MAKNKKINNLTTKRSKSTASGNGPEGPSAQRVAQGFANIPREREIQIAGFYSVGDLKVKVTINRKSQLHEIKYKATEERKSMELKKRRLRCAVNGM